MNILHALVLTTLSAAAAMAADVIPTFNATLTVGRESRFVLLGGDGKASPWLKVGDAFAGYTVKAYDATGAALELEKDGKVTRVSLAADAAVGAGRAGLPGLTPATIEDATAVLDKMHFEQMIDRTMAIVKKQQTALLDRAMGSSRQGVDREAFLAHQQRMIDMMMAAISGPGMKADMAKVYSEVFSKEELDGLASFYSSPLGETFSEKQPLVTEKMNQVLMPRMMAIMPKIQQETQAFIMEQRTKQAAAPAAPAAVKTDAPAAPAPVTPTPKE